MLFPLTASAFEFSTGAAAAAGVEARYLFLYDKRLVDFCLALPSQYKLSQGWTRFILRKAMEGQPPSSVQWGETRSISDLISLSGCSTATGALLDAVLEETISTGVGRYFDMDTVRAAYRKLAVDETARAGAEGQLVGGPRSLASGCVTGEVALVPPRGPQADPMSPARPSRALGPGKVATP